MAKEFNVSYYTNKVSALRIMAQENPEMEKQYQEQQEMLSKIFCDDVPVEFFNHKRYFYLNTQEIAKTDVTRPHKLKDCKYLTSPKGKFKICDRFKGRFICNELQIRNFLSSLSLKSLVSDTVLEKLEVFFKRGRDFLMLTNYHTNNGMTQIELSIIRLSN